MFPTACSICLIQESDHKQSLLQMKDRALYEFGLAYFAFILSSTWALLWIFIFQKTIFDQYNPSAVTSDFLILN